VCLVLAEIRAVYKVLLADIAQVLKVGPVPVQLLPEHKLHVAVDACV
jgi:hypothetical protein